MSANNRPQTLEAKLGFGDRELASAEHDELMVWADSHAEEIVTASNILKQGDAYLSQQEEKMRTAWEKDGQPGELALPPRPTSAFVVTNREWEHVIHTGSGFTVGFVDLRIDVREHYLDCRYRNDPKPGTEWQREPVWIPDWSTLAWRDTPPRGCVSVEVKSHIQSAGALIRQLRLYEKYLPQDVFVVVSPDKRFDSVLKAQGFFTLEDGP